MARSWTSDSERSWINLATELTYEDADELIELAPPGDEDLADGWLLLQRQRSIGVAGRVLCFSIVRKDGSVVMTTSWSFR